VEAVEYFLLPLPAPDKVDVGGSATRPLSRDGGMEELHGGDPTVGARSKV